jgi:hypothetical protein
MSVDFFVGDVVFDAVAPPAERRRQSPNIALRTL